MTNEQIASIIIPCAIALAVIAVLVLCAFFGNKIVAALKTASNKIDNNESKLFEAFKKVLPEKLCVELLPLVKEQVVELFKALEEKQLKKLDAIAKALASMRSMPDINRDELIAILEEDAKAEAKMVEVVYNVSDDIKAMAEGKNFTPDIE